MIEMTAIERIDIKARESDNTNVRVEAVEIIQIVAMGVGVKWDDGQWVPTGGVAWMFLKKVDGVDYNTVFAFITTSDVTGLTTALAWKSDVGHTHAMSDVTGLTSALSWKEGTITAGTISQYWRWDKSFQTLDTSVVPENGNLYHTESRVRASVLTGLSITGSSISSSDSIIQAFWKLQNQINGLLGGAIYQWTWNASTNSPSITGWSGTKGHYYVVSVAWSTNIDGVTDWKVWDWIIYNGTAWQKVDNTAAVWWQITWTLSNQTDLQNALDTKLESVVAGDNITIDNTDPLNPIINAATPATLTYMFANIVSDIGATYLQAVSLNSYVTGTKSDQSGTATTSWVTIGRFATNLGFPNITLIPAGEITIHYDTEKVAGSNNYYTYAQVYKRNLAGTETLIATSDNSPQSALNTQLNTTVTAVLSSDVTLLSTDRIVVKVVAVMLSSTATIHVYWDDDTSARIELPTSQIDATNYMTLSSAQTATATKTNSQATSTTTLDWWVYWTSSTATSGNQKASTAARWIASGWKTDATASARQVDWRAWVLPEQGTSNPSSVWKLQSQTNNWGYSDRITVDDKLGGKGFQIHTNGSNVAPWTTRAMTIENSGTYSWLDWTFSGTRKVAMGANSSGGFDMYMSWGNYLGLINWNTNTLFSYIYPSAFVHYNDGYFWGRISAGSASYPSSILSSAGSFASKAIRVTSNYTLTVNESVIYADASSAACSGTPTYSCSHWTNQTDCEKWDAHGGCSWFAGNSCSVYNGDQSSCESTSGCAWESNDCSYIGAYDEYSCTVYSGCSWSNNPWDCSPFDEWTCTSTTWCSASYDYCYNYSDGGWDGTACATVSWHGCNYDSGSGACSDWMGDMGWFTSCSGSYDNYSCTGTYYTGNCTGTYWASCTGTSACSGINDSANCGFETGCSWSTTVTINLPQITTVPHRHYWVYNDSSSGADVILQPYSGDQIDKTTTYTLANYKDSVHIQAFYESVSCGSFNEWACTPSGCTKQYSSCSWDWMSGTCSGNAVCDGIGDQTTCESTTYFSYCSGNYYSVKNWYLLSRS